ncbi:hypothetical protein [Actinoplanes sp. CA-252034]|uniref:hypothetical protein n=1 Tax=Actinoplanes sp. CA-252034 TaxID=3239906 RepID=UPI003D99BF46
METFRCAECGNALSVPVRLVELPAQPHSSLLDCHHVNPPLLDPRTYAIDESAYGYDQVVDTFVLSPGDVRGTRIVHDLAVIGCWSLAGGNLCVACESCGVLVASRTDDCRVAQETRFHPSVVVRETTADDVDDTADPFALIAAWDNAPPETRRHGWLPKPTRPRPELTATRWGSRGLRRDLYRDDPPA